MIPDITQPHVEQKEPTSITVRFAGDSGDGMQLTGDQFTDTAALMGNDFATFPDYPAEIRAPAGTLPGVSSFQIQISDSLIFTPGDISDVLIAMNPAALKVNIENVKKGGLVIINESVFNEANLQKANWAQNPLNDDTLQDFSVMKVALSELTHKSLRESGLKPNEIERCKNFFALGIMFWLYDRDKNHTVEWIQKKFSKRAEIAQANITALNAGYTYADVTEAMPEQRQIRKAKLDPGTYRKIMGNEALAIGLVAAALLADKQLFYGSYPITPATDILQTLAKYKHFGVKTFQAEDEIAAMGVTIGASFGGQIAVTGTSGPGVCLKSEAINLAIMAELPLVIVNVQRGGPSTGMPTKTEQSDLLQALFGRNGETPICVLAPQSASDCFEVALEAVRIAVKYMTPVFILSDGYIANSAEAWKLPDLSTFKRIEIKHPTTCGPEGFLPYTRDPETLARPWALPGTPGLQHRIGGLGKADLTGNVSYDPDNNMKMHLFRAAKIQNIQKEIPPIHCEGKPSGDLLVLSWGGTFGPVLQAVLKLQKTGASVSHIHLRNLSPLPADLEDYLKAFKKILIPELNLGQLLFWLRGHFPSYPFVGYHKVKGQPFKIIELMEKIEEQL